MYTSDLYNQITDRISLTPSGEYELRKILINLDGEELENDLELED